MLRRFLLTGLIVLLLGSLLRVRTARAEPPDIIHFGPPPLAQTIQLYTPPRPNLGTSQADTSHAAVIQAHVLRPDEPVSQQAPAAGSSKSTGVSVATEAGQSNSTAYTVTPSPLPPVSSEPVTTTPVEVAASPGPPPVSSEPVTTTPVDVASSPAPPASSEPSSPASSTGGSSGSGAGVPSGVVVSAVLAGNCSGMVGLSVSVNDTAGNPMQGAGVTVQIELKTTTQHHDLPPTDAHGYTSVRVDIGSPASGFTVTWTVTATSAAGTGSTVTTCVNT